MKSILLALASTAALAASPPSPAGRFTGTWQLDVAASQLGMDHPGADYAMTRTIAWDGHTFTEDDTIRNMDVYGRKIPLTTAKVALLTDGQEHAFDDLDPFPGPSSKAAAIANWQGDDLVIAARGTNWRGAWTTTRRAYLSPDGQRMTEVAITVSATRDIEKRLVFVRAK